MKELLDVCLISFMFNSPAPNASKMRPKCVQNASKSGNDQMIVCVRQFCAYFI